MRTHVLKQLMDRGHALNREFSLPSAPRTSILQKRWML